MRERLTRLARTLRRRETGSEEKLWRALRNRQLDGWKFKRQVPRGPYIVDFFCFDASLVIEIDGSHHEECDNKLRDEHRSDYLRENGLRILRFSNSDVLENLDGVLDEIYMALGQTAPPALQELKPASDRHTSPSIIGVMRTEAGAKDSAQ